MADTDARSQTDSPAESDAGDAAADEDARVTRTWWYRLVVVGAIVAGIVLRIVLLRLPTGVLLSDEAVPGLMARHVLHDHQFSTFYWGQNYGGSLTSIPMAGVFAIFGDSTATLHAVPIVSSVIAAILVWRLGKRTIGEPGATFGALAFWIWPTNYVWLSTKEWGFYWSALIIGLAYLLVVLHLVERPKAWGLWLLLGLLAGLGWWTNPQILYLFVPGIVWLAIKLRAEIKWIVVSIPTALVGASPWLVWNIRHDWSALVPRSHQYDKGYFGNIEVLLRHGIPVMLGFNVIERWLVPVLFPAIYVLLLIGVAVGVALRPRKPWLLILVVVMYPLLWGAYPNTGVIGEGRYVLFLAPAFVLLLMHAARHPLVQVLLLVGALGVSADGVHRITCCTSPGAPDVAMPLHTGPLIRELERLNVDAFYGDYWIAFRVAFETHEKIVGSPRTFKRWPPYDARAAAQNPSTFVFVAKSKFGQGFERGLQRLGIGYDKVPAGDFVIFQTSQQTGVEPVLAAGSKPS